MDHSQVLIKTAKGQDEIRTKAFKLSARLRRMLIMVDGHASVEQLLQRFESLGDDVESQLESLVSDGFLAPREPVGASASAGASTGAPAAKPAPAFGQIGAEFNLEKAKGFARFVVLGSLGPVGARRVERIDAAKSAAELRAELDDLRDILPKLLPKRQAKQVWEQLEPLMLSIG